MTAVDFSGAAAEAGRGSTSLRREGCSPRETRPGPPPGRGGHQARAAGRIGAPRAVVADRQTEAVALLLGGDAHDRGVRLPGRVGERLGDDVIPATSTGSGTRPIAARSSSTPIEARRASVRSAGASPPLDKITGWMPRAISRRSSTIPFSSPVTRPISASSPAGCRTRRPAGNGCTSGRWLTRVPARWPHGPASYQEPSPPAAICPLVDITASSCR